MRQYLASIQHIVGPQALIGSSSMADTASVPSSFLDELAALRSQVDTLSDEVTTFMYISSASRTPY